MKAELSVFLKHEPTENSSFYRPTECGLDWINRGSVSPKL